MKTYFCQDWSREGGIDSCYEVTRMSLIEDRENGSCCVDHPQIGDLKIVDRVLFIKTTVVQEVEKMPCGGLVLSWWMSACQVVPLSTRKG